MPPPMCLTVLSLSHLEMFMNANFVDYTRKEWNRDGYMLNKLLAGGVLSTGLLNSVFLYGKSFVYTE